MSRKPAPGARVTVPDVLIDYDLVSKNKGVCRVVPTPVFSGICRLQRFESIEEFLRRNLDLAIPSIFPKHRNIALT